MPDRLPIAGFTENRMKTLGLDRGQLARRCGYQNVSKGLRKIDRILGGAISETATRPLLAALQSALEANDAEFSDAIAATDARLNATARAVEAEADRCWRASFTPHGYLLGSSPRPASITIYAMSGGSERWLKIRLDLSQSPAAFARQAMAALHKSAVVPFHGLATGFVINYTPDSAVRFDVHGDPVEVLDRAYRPGSVSVLVGGRL
jgi:hypothetical protein